MLMIGIDMDKSCTTKHFEGKTGGKTKVWEWLWKFLEGYSKEENTTKHFIDVMGKSQNDIIPNHLGHVHNEHQGASNIKYMSIFTLENPILLGSIHTRISMNDLILLKVIIQSCIEIICDIIIM